MATRIVTRDDDGSMVNVYPLGVTLDQVLESQTHAGRFYAKDADDNIITPAMIPADVFKAAWGFVPCTGTKASYTLLKTENKADAGKRLVGAIKDLVADFIDD
jgi:hypothetical protein